MLYQEEREKLLTEHYNEAFKDHVASFIDLPDGTQVLKWRNKRGGTDYYFNAVLQDGALMIYGDLGEAVFMWYSHITWKFFANLQFGYFASKCCASVVGKHFVEWDKKHAVEVIMQVAGEGDFDLALFRQCDGEDALGSAEEWLDWLQDHNEVLIDDFDGETFGYMVRVGEVIHGRCFGYLYGIKLAIKQWEERLVAS